MEDEGFLKIVLDELLEWNILGITKTSAKNFMDACIVCLANQHHHSNVNLKLVENGHLQQARLVWTQILDDQTRRTWRDLYEAVEYGATGLAILLVIKRTPYTILERSVRGTGFDYWLLDKESAQSSEWITQGNARLEISGVLKADKDSIIKNRIKEKLNQVSNDSTFPTLIIVVEFSHPEVHMVWKHDPNT
ncbi:MAG: hypothetical protein SFZ02_03545 [bacterium]|nr:hypothetical protein [bacterium]